MSTTRAVDIALPPAQAASTDLVHAAAAEAAGLAVEHARGMRVLRRSIDARSKHPLVRLRVEVSDRDLDTPVIQRPELPDVNAAPEVLIVGCGPAGLFAALECIQNGLRPVLLERGKPIRERRRDLVRITREHEVDPDSNYCFGEGGAGTFSDGKLYTRSKKRGDVQAVLELLVAYGAPPDILVDAHPHIGTNKLPAIVTAMREAIQLAGGEVHFGCRVSDLKIEEDHLRGVGAADGRQWRADHVILATGHSARDIYALLERKGISMRRKEFALGVRIEHPQELIDRIQYHCDVRDPYLPPASYELVHQVDGYGVYSFCMCPGGIIAPCATANDEVVTNGWSPSKRNNPFANSGIVVTIPVGLGAPGALGGMQFQKTLEHAAWKAGGQDQTAPAQRMVDMIQGRTSTDLPDCSYPPGIVSRPLHELLPEHVSVRLREGLKAFGRKRQGYLTNEAVLVAVESRTSAPVTIPRDPVSLEHVQVGGLFPCGEGAGHAGGIVSAALDGIRVAQRIATLRYPARS
ncbi:MAG: FAD-binding protein [Flavobacteriales bacterium]|nr:FAD-binding protein [Flavobacteriales bacterium]